MADVLNGRQQLFVLEYLVDRNAEQAAIRAGYSPAYARGNAHKLVAHSGIAAEIQRQGAKVAAKLEITQEWVLQRLRAIADANATDYLTVKTMPAEKMGIHPLTGEVVMLPAGWEQYVTVIDTDTIPAEKRHALAGIKQGRNGIEIKLHDSLRALELLGKHTGLFDSGANTPVQENNLFDAIVGGAGEGIETDDIPELEQEAEAGDDVVEPAEV